MADTEQVDAADPQRAFTAWLRDPSGPPPAGWDARRAGVYRDLVFNNLRELLAGTFPVIRAVLGDEAWAALVRAFLRGHACATPLFPEVAREFLRFLDDHEPLPRPFLRELAHYEWAELALQIADAHGAPPRRVAAGAAEAAAPVGALLDGALALSPLAWPLAYAWPVHRIGPEFKPDTPPPQPTLLLLRREPGGQVRFSELTPLAWRLLERIGEVAGDTGRAHLQAIAVEAGHADAEAWLAAATPLLLQLHALGVLQVE